MENSSFCLVKNAKIYVSGEEDYHWMVIDKMSGLIRNIGRGDYPSSSKEITETVDFGGHRILPGLHESHIHFGSFGLSLMHLQVGGCQSISELQDRLRVFAEEHPHSEWITGHGWEHDVLGCYPDKADLDLVCPDRPVLLFRACLHIAVVNSKALQIAGIDRNTTDPVDGQIDRYPDNHEKAGEPTGIIREAVDALFSCALQPTDDTKLEAIKQATSECLKRGITSVHALEGDNTWKVLCRLQDDLKIRVFYVGNWRDRDDPDFPGPCEQRGKKLSCNRIKIFSDGALGPCTAALSLPYKRSKDNYGILLHSQAELNALVLDATSSGYRLEIHAIGDAAADAVLTALETSKVAPEKRPIIVHCQILREDLLVRMKSCGAIASIQPQFVQTDGRWLEDILPNELHKFAYAWKTLLNYGIACCGGSDAPVESPEPLVGIHDAIFRYRGTRSSKDCYKPEECLSVEQAIDLYTKGGAYAAMREDNLGQLLPGYLADFISLDTDPITDPSLFLTAKVQQVWVAGQRQL